MCHRPWGHKESDRTQQLNNNSYKEIILSPRLNGGYFEEVSKSLSVVSDGRNSSK